MAANEHGGHLHRHGDSEGTVASADTPVDTQDAVPAPMVETDIIVAGQPVGSGGSGFHLVFKGVNYVADINGSYANADSLSDLATDHINAAALTVDYGIDAADNTVYADTGSDGYTESDTNVAAAADEAVNDGLSVMVRPLIDFLPASSSDSSAPNPKNGDYSASEFRAYFNPGAAGSAGANSFFASYTNLMVQEATLAQQNGAQLFCIGTELDQITGPSYESYWDTLITDVKQVFTGKLTYSALWDDSQSPWQYGGSGLAAGTGDITTQISFWSQLDYVGIDEYAPISDKTNPSVATLVKGWTQTPTDALTKDVTGQQSLISYYEGISATLNMPLLFTELGYADSSDAAINPAVPGYDQDGNPDNATADPTLQANLYTAFFDAWQQDGNSSLAGTYLWNWEPLDSTNTSSPFQVDGVPAETSVATGYAACYAAGTLIATPEGEVAVETLQAGDLVLTASGVARPVTWLGHRRIRFAARSDVPQPHPIRIRADAFAPGQPRRDLVLSPDHAVFVEGVLIPIRRLVNGATILRETVASVVYWHVELATHDILLAEGLPAESYLDTGNRAAFANAGVTMLQASFERDPGRVWAEHACAELVEEGPIPQEARARLAARAEALGRALPVTLDVLLSRIGSTRVVVPGEVEIVRLVSGTARPPEDGRRLGALVTAIRVDGVAVPLEDSLLADGFHAIETHGPARVRWTDGAATLATGRAPSHRILRIEVAMLKSDEPPAMPSAWPASALA